MKYLSTFLMSFLISQFVTLQVIANVCSQEWWQNGTVASMPLPEDQNNLVHTCYELYEPSKKIECVSYQTRGQYDFQHTCYASNNKNNTRARCTSHQRIDWLQTCNDELANTPLHIVAMVAQEPLLIDLFLDTIPHQALTTKNLLNETPLMLIERRGQRAHLAVDQTSLAFNQATSHYLNQRATTLRSVRNAAYEVMLDAKRRYDQARREQLVAVYIHNFLTVLENQKH